jgi:hypothetical protein
VVRGEPRRLRVRPGAQFPPGECPITLDSPSTYAENRADAAIPRAYSGLVSAILRLPAYDDRRDTKRDSVMRIFYECFESPLVSLFFAATLLVAALQILGVIPQSFWLFTL